MFLAPGASCFGSFFHRTLHPGGVGVLLRTWRLDDPRIRTRILRFGAPTGEPISSLPPAGLWRAAEPLRWELLPRPPATDKLRLHLVQADGAPAPKFFCVSRAGPCSIWPPMRCSKGRRRWTRNRVCRGKCDPAPWTTGAAPGASSTAAQARPRAALSSGDSFQLPSPGPSEAPRRTVSCAWWPKPPTAARRSSMAASGLMDPRAHTTRKEAS